MSIVNPLQFGEKYILLDQIGAGGVAEVFRGKLTRDRGFEKLIVIKKLLAEHNRNREMIDIFIREARLAALLQHDNIAATYDFGEIGGEYFLAMEYLFGKNLHSVMACAGEHQELFGLAEALLICSKICEGMEYAHNLADLQNKPLNIVHRDLTPHNIFITYEGKVKILDFGVAKAELFDNKTRDGVVKGKISYMSPERLSGESVDSRSDIFSIGILLYEMISKKRMYYGDTAELIRKCLTADYDNLKTIMPDLEPAVYAILDKSLAVEIDKRYQSCAEMHADIDDLLFQMQQRIDSRHLKESIRSLFSEEYEAEHRKVTEVLKFDAKNSNRRDKTDIDIAQERRPPDALLPEDKTAFLLRRPPAHVVKLYSARLAGQIQQTYLQAREMLARQRIGRLHVAAGAAFLLLVMAVGMLMTRDRGDELDSTIAVQEQAIAQPEPDKPVTVVTAGDAVDTSSDDPVTESGEGAVGNGAATSPAEGIVEKALPEPTAVAPEPISKAYEPEAEEDSTAVAINQEPVEVPVLKRKEMKRKKEASNKAEQTTPPRLEKNSVQYQAVQRQITQAETVEIRGETLSFEESAEDLARREKLTSLHVKARQAMLQGRLIQPEGQSAYAYFSEILQLDPKDNVAADGLKLICAKYSELAEKSLAANEYGKADEYVKNGLSVIYDYSRLIEIKKRIDRERQDHVFELSEKARLCLDADKLSTPADDSAYFYYNEIARVDPGNKLVGQGHQKIADRYAKLGEEAFRQFDYTTAELCVRRGLQIVPDHYYLLSLKEELARSDLERFGHSMKKKINKLLSD